MPGYIWTPHNLPGPNQIPRYWEMELKALLRLLMAHHLEFAMQVLESAAFSDPLLKAPIKITYIRINQFFRASVANADLPPVQDKGARVDENSILQNLRQCLRRG